MVNRVWPLRAGTPREQTFWAFQNRTSLGFGTDDQLYALELSHATDRHLLQVTLSPGRADALLDDDGSAAFTAAGRAQLDLGSRAALIVSGLYQAASDVGPENGLVGVVLGFAPVSRLAVWGQADLRLREGTGTAYTLTSEVAVEVYTGIWLKVVPQLRTEHGDSSAGTFRLGAGLDLPWAAKFAQKSRFDEAAEHPKAGEIEKALRQLSAQLQVKFTQLTDAELSAPGPREFPIPDKSLRGTIAFLIYHEAYHVGQVGYLKKWLGYPGIVDG